MSKRLASLSQPDAFDLSLKLDSCHLPYDVLVPVIITKGLSPVGRAYKCPSTAFHFLPLYRFCLFSDTHVFKVLSEHTPLRWTTPSQPMGTPPGALFSFALTHSTLHLLLRSLSQLVADSVSTFNSLGFLFVVDGMVYAQMGKVIIVHSLNAAGELIVGEYVVFHPINFSQQTSGTMFVVADSGQRLFKGTIQSDWELREYEV